MSSIRITLLGGFDLRRADGETVVVAAKKARALLAYLSCQLGRPVSRERVQALLWGTRDELQAQGSLRHLLTTLRHDLGAELSVALWADREHLALREELVEADVWLLDRSLQLATPTAMEEAVHLYRGPLLDGQDLAETSFQDWIVEERRRLHRSVCDACRSLLAGANEGQVSQFAHRLLSLDFCDEDAHRALMRHYARSGNVGLAMRQYEACRNVLAREIGASPSLDTETLAHGIREGAFTPLGAASDLSTASTAAVAPTIAVLPFSSSNEPDLRLLARGMTEDIATELSRYRQLFVRAKGVTVPEHERMTAYQLGVELGVKFVVDGSIRRSAHNIRVTTQLIDIASNRQLWAERFDSVSSDIFQIQDQIVATIAGTLAGRVAAAGLAGARRKPPGSLAAYECVLRAEAISVGDPTAENEARQLLERAAALDPSYARANAGLAYLLSLEWFRDAEPGVFEILDRGIDLAKSAAAFDDSDALCHDILGWLHLLRKQFDLAIHHKQRALDLSPNDPGQNACQGVLLTFLGEPAEATKWYERARQLDHFFEPAWYWRMVGMNHFVARRYECAVEAFLRSPNKPAWVSAYLAASYAFLGLSEAARRARLDAKATDPSFSARRLAAKEPFRISQDNDHLLAGLRKAGFFDADQASS